jgi:hypothetical protein
MILIQFTIWWLQIVAAVEMKRKNSQNWQALVIQLFGYLRRILREQLDRRFVFGLTLGPDKMTVWLHDRSGVIGTKTSIDIHKVSKSVFDKRAWNTNVFSVIGTCEIYPSNCCVLAFVTRKARFRSYDGIARISQPGRTVLQTK